MGHLQSNEKSDEYPIQGKSLFGRQLEGEILDQFAIAFNKLMVFTALRGFKIFSQAFIASTFII